MHTWFLGLLLFVSVWAKAQLHGKVISVADGDSFTLLTEQSTKVRVRLHGIDCPERKQPYGMVARQFTSNLVSGKKVTVHLKGRDRYKRIIGTVYVDGRCLNEELLKAGLAWHYFRHDKNPVWRRMEEQSRSARRGLWRDRSPVPPWDFRKMTK